MLGMHIRGSDKEKGCCLHVMCALRRPSQHPAGLRRGIEGDLPASVLLDRSLTSRARLRGRPNRIHTGLLFDLLPR